MNKYFTKKNILYLIIALYQGATSETIVGFILSVGIVLGIFYLWDVYVSKYVINHLENLRLRFAKTNIMQNNKQVVQIALFVLVMALFVYLSF